MHDNNVAAQSYDTIAGTFAEYITKCRQALDDLAAASNADAFERSSGFSLPFVYSSSSDSDFQKKEKLRLLIQSEIEAYERLQKELDDIRNMPGAMQNFPGDMAHFLVVRESGRLQKAGAAAQQTQQSRGMVALTGAGDGGLLHRWRKFRPGAMDLSGAPLSGLVFGGVKFDGCIMRQTAFQNTVFLNCSFVNADAEGADFTKASFTMARMNGACFKQCNFSGCTLSFIWVDDKTDFEGATFTDCAATWSGESGSHEEIAKFKGRLSQEQIQQLKKGGCFVATACYGSYDHPAVRELRWFRDHALMESSGGRRLVDAYYRLSPPVAAFLQSRPLAAAAVRRCFLAPVLRVVALARRRRES